VVEVISSHTVDTARDTKSAPFSYRSSSTLTGESTRSDNVHHWRGLPCPFSPAFLGSGSRLGPPIAKKKPRVSRVPLVPHFPLLIHHAASFFTCMSIAVCLREAL